MQYTQSETDLEITLSPAAAAVGTVIVLHGLGADGWDFVPVVQELRLPDALPLRFVFPHAPVRPVTVNNGYEMRAWYDIRDFSITGREDLEGITQATDRINGYVQREAAHGVEPGRVVLAGFSQGGEVALHAGLRHAQPLAGIVRRAAAEESLEEIAHVNAPEGSVRRRRAREGASEGVGPRRGNPAVWCEPDRKLCVPASRRVCRYTSDDDGRSVANWQRRALCRAALRGILHTRGARSVAFERSGTRKIPGRVRRARPQASTACSQRETSAISSRPTSCANGYACHSTA